MSCKEEKCENPEELKSTPGECSPEQIQKCHGDAAEHPCAPSGGCCCQQPDKLKGKPGECSPEQIKECHGEAEEHPCDGEKA